MKELLLCKDIYSDKRIRTAIAAYSEYTNVSILEEDTYFSLCFYNCKYDEGRTVKEFENYLIGLENS